MEMHLQVRMIQDLKVCEGTSGAREGTRSSCGLTLASSLSGHRKIILLKILFYEEAKEIRLKRTQKYAAGGTTRMMKQKRILRRMMVRAEGLEPPHLTAPDPKSGVSANFTTRAQ
jgi:hypothetical protein